jgi:hypothetical protein
MSVRPTVTNTILSCCSYTAITVISNYRIVKFSFFKLYNYNKELVSALSSVKMFRSRNDNCPTLNRELFLS